jgi:hypothetical protein
MERRAYRAVQSEARYPQFQRNCNQRPPTKCHPKILLEEINIPVLKKETKKVEYSMNSPQCFVYWMFCVFRSKCFLECRVFCFVIFLHTSCSGLNHALLGLNLCSHGPELCSYGPESCSVGPELCSFGPELRYLGAWIEVFRGQNWGM